MARVPFETRPKSVEFDIQALLNNDNVKAGFLCMSETTWELAYNLVLTYGPWRSRYYFTDENGQKLTITDEEYDQVIDKYYLALEEIQMAGCEDLVLAVDNLTAQVGLINTAVSGQGGCGCDGGAFDPDALGNPDAGQIDQAHLAARCETANIIVDKVQYAIRQLDVVNLDVLLLGGISAATAVLGALVLAGPVGWGTILAIGVVSGILLLLAQLGVGELGDIDTVISANQDDLVCALYTAASTEAAKTAFLDVLDGAGIGTVGQSLVGFMLFNDVLNQLFVPTGTYIGATYDYLNDDYSASDCANCEGPLIFGRLQEFPDAEEFGGSGDIAFSGSYRNLTATLHANGFYYITLTSVFQPGDYNFRVDYTATSLANGNGRGWARYSWDGDENVLDAEEEGSQDPMPTGFYTSSALVWIGSVSFTVTVQLSAPAE